MCRVSRLLLKKQRALNEDQSHNVGGGDCSQQELPDTQCLMFPKSLLQPLSQRRYLAGQNPCRPILFVVAFASSSSSRMAVLL